MFFTKSQRVGLVLLICLLLIIIAANVLVSNFYKKNIPPKDTNFISQVENFKNSLKDRANNYQKYSPSDFYENTQNSFQKQIFIPQLFVFDPNTLDSAGFVKLGLKPFIAKNIVNYRKKGGKFVKPDDFARVYGLREQDFLRLKPYISIAEIKNGNSEKIITQSVENKYIAKTDTLIIDLNTADTAELKKLRGIGNHFAWQIVSYRKKLGGYYSVNQLLEISDFSAQTFEKIKNNLKIDNSKIKKINVNWATVEQLNMHPYLNFYQAKAIFELRKKRKFASITDLKSIKELSEEDIEKIAPYLDFK